MKDIEDLIPPPRHKYVGPEINGIPQLLSSLRELKPIPDGYVEDAKTFDKILKEYGHKHDGDDHEEGSSKE